MDACDDDGGDRRTTCTVSLLSPAIFVLTLSPAKTNGTNTRPFFILHLVLHHNMNMNLMTAAARFNATDGE